jgi:preprotein translocase subunit SecG
MLANVVYYFLLFIEAISSLLLIVVILMQRSKTQGAGVAFGGGMGEAVFGSQMGNVLTKSTVVLSFVFLVNTTALAIVGPKRGSGSLTDDMSITAQPAPGEVTSPQSAPFGAPIGQQPPVGVPVGQLPAGVQPVVPEPVAPVDVPADAWAPVDGTVPVQVDNAPAFGSSEPEAVFSAEPAPVEVPAEIPLAAPDHAPVEAPATQPTVIDAGDTTAQPE